MAEELIQAIRGCKFAAVRAALRAKPTPAIAYALVEDAKAGRATHEGKRLLSDLIRWGQMTQTFWLPEPGTVQLLPLFQAAAK